MKLNVIPTKEELDVIFKHYKNRLMHPKRRQSRIWILDQKRYFTRVVKDSKNKVVHVSRGNYNWPKVRNGKLVIRLLDKIWEVREINKPDFECSGYYDHVPNPIKEENWDKECSGWWTPYVRHHEDLTLDFVIVKLIGPVKGKELQKQMELF